MSSLALSPLLTTLASTTSTSSCTAWRSRNSLFARVSRLWSRYYKLFFLWRNFEFHSKIGHLGKFVLWAEGVSQHPNGKACERTIPTSNLLQIKHFLLTCTFLTLFTLFSYAKLYSDAPKKKNSKTIDSMQNMLKTTTLNLGNDVILSTLGISSCDFTFGFHKRPQPFNQPMWDSSPSNRQPSSPQTKYTIEPPLRPMEPSNSLPLIEAWLLLWNPRTKYTLCSTLESPFYYIFKAHNFFIHIWEFYWHY